MIDLFSVTKLPPIARVNYARELRATATYPIAAALAEGSFASVVAAKYFQAPALLISVIVAAPMFGNVVALLWSRLSEGRPKVAFMNRLQWGVLACLLLVAATWFLPLEIGAWAFAGLMVVSRVVASGIVTQRNVIWRLNYPDRMRGRIVGHISVVTNITLALTTTIGASVLDATPGAYAVVYLIGAMLGVVGIVQFSKIRVRHEARLVRAEKLRKQALQGTGWRNSILIRTIADCRQLLREDPVFRRYQRWQMVQGASFMMMQPPLFKMVSKELTDPTGEYRLATVVLHALPLVLTIVTLPLWAQLFDRMPFHRFRLAQSSTALLTHAAIFGGAMAGELWIVAIGMVAFGVSMAGGTLAWNLGQNAFAARENLARYMGVHVMLTGLRGMFFPFVGTLVYDFTMVGRFVFGITTLMCLMALIGYWRMARDFDADGLGNRPGTA